MYIDFEVKKVKCNIFKQYVKNITGEKKTWERLWRKKNMERFTNLRVILAQGPC